MGGASHNHSQALCTETGNGAPWNSRCSTVQSLKAANITDCLLLSPATAHVWCVGLHFTKQPTLRSANPPSNKKCKLKPQYLKRRSLKLSVQRKKIPRDISIPLNQHVFKHPGKDTSFGILPVTGKRQGLQHGPIKTMSCWAEQKKAYRLSKRVNFQVMNWVFSSQKVDFTPELPETHS